MKAERLQQIEQLFHAARECEESRRAEFLREACGGDEALRHEVETLLACATETENIYSAAMEPAAAFPTNLGRYRILRLLGEGGMGAVYEAEQEHPRRTVALKVIKPGLTNPELLRRFERESQALGRLQHPGIAQIYEGGTANTGLGPQPWFAMECIRGQSLRDYAEAHHLNTRQRLELMVKICDAVQHAHQRSLIHRDLKPGNILVDETGQPKILDFGIARVMDNDARATQQTSPGQLMGTLAYMSPEQVLGDPLELDTRSDIYALGVILYELLSGRLPHTLVGQPLEVMRMIREENPQPLSSVNRFYRGDIETIVSKALEKDKKRRYTSAADLGADIQRYLRDEPIIARPPSATYQLQKFARRHKALVAGVAAVFVVLVAGIIASTWEATRARRAEQAATAVDDFLQNDLLAQASASVQARPDIKPDPDLTVRTALDRAAARIEGKFKGQPLVEAAIRQTIGTTYRDLGLFPEAQKQIERALELRRRGLGQDHPDTLTSMDRLALLYWDQGKYAQAEPLLTSVMKARTRVLGALHPDTLETTNNLALVYANRAKFAQAEPLYTKVLEIRRRALGEQHPQHAGHDGRPGAAVCGSNPVRRGRTTLQESNRVAASCAGRGTSGHADHDKQPGAALCESKPVCRSRAPLQPLLEVSRRVLGEEHPNTLGTMNNLAQIYGFQGKYGEAETLYIKVQEVARRTLGEEHQNTLITMSNLATIYQNEGKYEQSERLCTKVLGAFRRVLGEEHPRTLGSMSNLALVYRDEGKDAQAEPILAKVLGVRRRLLGEEHPDTLVGMSRLAALYRDQGKFELAEPMLVKVLGVQRRVLGNQQRATLVTMSNLAQAYLTESKYTQAEPLLREAIAGFQKSPNGAWDRYDCERLLGASLAGLKKYAEAEPALLSGYQGMLQRVTTVPVANRRKVDQAGNCHYPALPGLGKA